MTGDADDADDADDPDGAVSDGNACGADGWARCSACAPQLIDHNGINSNHAICRNVACLLIPVLGK